MAAYFTDADLLPRTRCDRETRWASLLQSAPGTRTLLEGQPPVSAPKVVAAGSWYRRHVVGDRCLAVGDAAMAFDPLSGQGIYRALETGVAAAQAISSAFDGDVRGLAEYSAYVRRTYQAYLLDRHQIYGLERRWPSAPFWARRQCAADSLHVF